MFIHSWRWWREWMGIYMWPWIWIYTIFCLGRLRRKEPPFTRRLLNCQTDISIRYLCSWKHVYQLIMKEYYTRFIDYHWKAFKYDVFYRLSLSWVFLQVSNYVLKNHVWWWKIPRFSTTIQYHDSILIRQANTFESYKIYYPTLYQPEEFIENVST